MLGFSSGVCACSYSWVPLGRKPNSILSWNFSYTTAHLLLSFLYCLLNDSVYATKFTLLVKSPEGLFQEKKKESKTKICFWLAYSPSHERGTWDMTNVNVSWGDNQMACFTSGPSWKARVYSCPSTARACEVEERRTRRAKSPGRGMDGKETQRKVTPILLCGAFCGCVHRWLCWSSLVKHWMHLGTCLPEVYL